MSSGGKNRRPGAFRTPCEADGSPGGRGRGGEQLVEARRLGVGVLLAGAVAVGAAAGLAVGVGVPTPAGATTSASALYKDALATTHAWSVHYSSDSTESKVTLVESGDAGPASASQT